MGVRGDVIVEIVGVGHIVKAKGVTDSDRLVDDL